MLEVPLWRWAGLRLRGVARCGLRVVGGALGSEGRRAGQTLHPPTLAPRGGNRRMPMSCGSSGCWLQGLLLSAGNHPDSSRETERCQSLPNSGPHLHFCCEG